MYLIVALWVCGQQSENKIYTYMFASLFRHIIIQSNKSEYIEYMFVDNPS